MGIKKEYAVPAGKRRGLLDNDEWMHREFVVRYGGAEVVFHRDDYVEHDAQYLTDEAMELLCRLIEAELPYYEDVDRIAAEYASGEALDTPTLDDLVDTEAHDIMVNRFGCPVRP